jgi:hypothetical protein
MPEVMSDSLSLAGDQRLGAVGGWADTVACQAPWDLINPHQRPIRPAAEDQPGVKTREGAMVDISKRGGHRRRLERNSMLPRMISAVASIDGEEGDLAAVGVDVDDPIGVPRDVHVVLDHHHLVALVYQLMHHSQQRSEDFICGSVTKMPKFVGKFDP